MSLFAVNDTRVSGWLLFAGTMYGDFYFHQKHHLSLAVDVELF